MTDIKTLVVDDTVDMRLVLTQILKQNSFSFEEAKNGEEAVAKLMADPEIKLILLDLLLPDFDGLIFLQKTADVRTERDIKTIVISGKRDRETVAKAVQLGANDYIVKPIYPEALTAKIKSLFRIGSVTEQYNQILTQLKAKLNGSFIHPDIQITTVTEMGVAIHTSASFDINSQLRLNCDKLSAAVGLPSEFICRVTSCVKVGFGKYDVSANFVGITEDIATKIRALAIRGEKITEQVITGNKSA